jgi:integrase
MREGHSSMSVNPLGTNRFQVRVYNPHGPEYRRVIVGLRAAQRHEAEMRAKLAAGSVDVRGNRLTFDDYAATHLSTRNLRPQTQARYASDLRRHVAPVIGQRPLRSIRYSDVKALSTRLERDLSQRYAAQVLALVRSILRAAALDRLIERSPAEAVPPIKVRAQQPQIATWAQVRAMVDASPTSTGVMLGLAAMTGLRAGEVMGLAVDDVDFLRGELRVQRQVTWMSEARSPSDHGHAFGPPKTPDSVRTVPLAPACVALLAAHLAATPAATVTLPWREHGAGEPQTHALIFHTRGGAVMPSSLPVRMRQAAARAGLSDVGTPHGLRHLFTTTLHDAGIPLRTIDAVTGHATGGVTLGVYAHVTADAISRVREVIALAWGGDQAHAAVV